METLIANAIATQGDEPINANVHLDLLYHALRTKEQRIYTDEQLIKLPNIDKQHPYYGEWKIRKHSAERLIRYLKKKKAPLQILEVGCGNGWLANKIATINTASVVAIDSNAVELNQAKSVFKSNNLHFELMSFKGLAFKDKKFDVILFAASIQYFPILEAILTEAKSCLTYDGEIHIIDTNFYDSNSVDDAVERTQAYFKKMGFEAMALNYFHHQLIDLELFNYKILYHPKAWVSRVFTKNPFYWICIK